MTSSLPDNGNGGVGPAALTPSSSGEEDVQTTTTATLQFRDCIDLQTRLQLLPLIDESCLGAKVVLYTPADDGTEEDLDMADMTVLQIVGQGGGGGEECGEEEDWTTKDFASILSDCREMVGPIVVTLGHRHGGGNEVDSPANLDGQQKKGDDGSSVARPTPQTPGTTSEEDEFYTPRQPQPRQGGGEERFATPDSPSRLLPWKNIGSRGEKVQSAFSTFISSNPGVQRVVGTIAASHASATAGGRGEARNHQAARSIIGDAFEDGSPAVTPVKGERPAAVEEEGEKDDGVDREDGLERNGGELTEGGDGNGNAVGGAETASAAAGITSNLSSQEDLNGKGGEEAELGGEDHREEDIGETVDGSVPGADDDSSANAADDTICGNSTGDGVNKVQAGAGGGEQQHEAVTEHVDDASSDRESLTASSPGDCHEGRAGEQMQKDDEPTSPEEGVNDEKEDTSLGEEDATEDLSDDDSKHYDSSDDDDGSTGSLSSFDSHRSGCSSVTDDSRSVVDDEESCNEQVPPPPPADADRDTPSSKDSKHGGGGGSPNDTAAGLLRGRLRQWGCHVRSASNVLAAETAQRAASLSTAVVDAAAKAAENRSLDNGQEDPSAVGCGEGDDDASEESSSAPPCQIFVQTSSGYRPVPRRKKDGFASGGTAPALRVTNSSVLQVRESPDDPCPRTYNYQWYRSAYVPTRKDAANNERNKDETPVRNNSVSSPGSSARKIVATDSVVWHTLTGATYAAYQPSAVDVGRKLKCVVTIDDGDSDIAANVDGEDGIVRCELGEPVAADANLFNAARQSIAGGAVFSNLRGRGPAEGREFRLKIEIGRNQHAEGEMSSLLSIFQVSGSTSEPLCGDSPTPNVTAVVDPSNPRMFDIVLPSSLPPSAVMVEALAVQGKFQLIAPVRVSRESLLLALGIANFKGKPSELSVKSVLFPEEPSEQTNDESLKKAGDDSEDSEASDIERNSGDEHDSTSTGQCSSLGPNRLQESQTDRKRDEKIRSLEIEVSTLTKMLSNRKAVTADLQKRLQKAEEEQKKKEDGNSRLRKELEQVKESHTKCYTSFRLAEKRIETHESVVARVKGDYSRRMTLLEEKVAGHEERGTECDSTIKSLQNEISVLSAAVEARDTKLSKVADMQQTITKLTEDLVKGERAQKELESTKVQLSNQNKELSQIRETEERQRSELEQSRGALSIATSALEDSQSQTAQYTNKVEKLQRENHKLCTERNNFKKKADSLSKEMVRLCRHGLGVKDIEKLLEDQDTMRREIASLKAGKLQALDELKDARAAYDRDVGSIVRGHRRVSSDASTGVEHRSELERVISDLTEYVNAMHSQLETMKEVNRTLTEELHAMQSGRDV